VFELISDPVAPWLALGFAVVVLVLRSAWFRGRRGERKTRATIRRRLDGSTYRSLHDLTLPTPDGTTQIDHVIVSQFGVFVIETKYLAGWIFGDETSRKWTQVVFGKRFRLQNPLRQNYKHLKAVQILLDLDTRCLHSVVVFVGSAKFKTVMPPNVLRRRQLIRYIKAKTEILLSGEQIDNSIRTLEKHRTTRATRRMHYRSLKKNRRTPSCPRCGSAMVLRTARSGRNSGGQFWGCTSFPRCRATKSAA
jgi:restriction system protein